LRCENSKLEGYLSWTGIQNAKQTKLILNGTSVNHLRDDSESWPASELLQVEGLVYQKLTLHKLPGAAINPRDLQDYEEPLDANARINWLNLQPKKHLPAAQPWIQLAKLLESGGDKAGAKRAVFQLRRHQAESSSFVLKLAKVLFALLEGQPLWILVPIIGCTLMGFLAFWHASDAGAMAPTEKDAYFSWSKGEPFPDAYPRFNPFIYSLENVVPLVKLGQDAKWAPDPAHKPSTGFISYSLLVGLRWFLILAGWFQATVLAAAVGSRFKS
jgi:hypothetical protein